FAYRDWDQTSGANGGPADASDNGGNTAFSAGTGGAGVATTTIKVVNGIVGEYQTTSQLFLASSNGVNAFTTNLAGSLAAFHVMRDVKSGDFNGDNLSDIVGREFDTGRWIVTLADARGNLVPGVWDQWAPDKPGILA